MATKRNKRRVKQRSKAHQAYVKKGMKRRARTRANVGYRTKLRRAKKARVKSKKAKKK